VKIHSHIYCVNEEVIAEVLGRINRQLSFDMIWTAWKTKRGTHRQGDIYSLLTKTGGGGIDRRTNRELGDHISLQFSK
jgi:hypothetical protein